MSESPSYHLSKAVVYNLGSPFVIDDLEWTPFRKKPVVIQATVWTGSVPIKIATLEGVMTVSPGDYIIQGVKGEFYACRPDIFWMTYEGVK